MSLDGNWSVKIQVFDCMVFLYESENFLRFFVRFNYNFNVNAARMIV